MPKQRRALGASVRPRSRRSVGRRPATLYHYTTGDGLLSMLQSGHIWATDCFYMNDPKEIRYGFDVLQQLVDETFQRTRSPKLQRFAEYMQLTVSDKIERGRVFLASFCSDGDLLSQWRGYGVSGGGYALGFDPERLLGPKPFENEPFRVLRPVVYDLEQQRATLTRWLNRYLVRSRVEVEEAKLPLLDLFSTHLMTFKNPNYSEEGEWRLIQFGRYTDDSWVLPMKFRVRGGQIVPYADIDLTRSKGRLRGKLPIRSIVFGPSVNPERARKALTFLCESQGYRCGPENAGDGVIHLRQSAIPFVT